MRRAARPHASDTPLHPLQAKMNYTAVLAMLLSRFHFDLAPEVVLFIVAPLAHDLRIVLGSMLKCPVSSDCGRICMCPVGLDLEG